MRFMRQSEQGVFLTDHLMEHGWGVVDATEVSMVNAEKTARQRLHAAAERAGLDVTTERLGDKRVLGYTDLQARDDFFDVQERVAGRWMVKDDKQVVEVKRRDRNRRRPGRPDR